MIDTEALRKKVIDLAIQGKLTEQLPSDGDAETLYAQIQEEKAKLVKEGKIKKDKPSADISDDEILFNIPPNWKWVHLNEIAVSSLGKTLNKSTDKGELCRYLCSINVQWDEINLDTVKTARFEEDEKEKYRLCKNDLLICEGGDSGRCAIWDSDEEMYYQNALHRVRFFCDINPKLYCYIIEFYKKSGIIAFFTKGIGIQHLVQSSLNALWLPLPPLHEQERIVNKLEVVMDAIDIIDDLQEKYRYDLATLKSKIIDAGIRGKLTEQLPEDGDAETLYAQIQEEKAKLIKEGKIKKEKLLPDITADEIPYEIPDNWKWVRIGQAFTLQSGKNKVSADIHSEQNGEFKYPCYGGNGLRGYVDETNVSGKHILIGRQGALCGNINLADNEFWATEHAVVVYQYGGTDVDCYAYMFKALNLNQYATSVAQPGLAVGNIEKVLIPLPPLSEQKRIAETIDGVLKILSI